MRMKDIEKLARKLRVAVMTDDPMMAGEALSGIAIWASENPEKSPSEVPGMMEAVEALQAKMNDTGACESCDSRDECKDGKCSGSDEPNIMDRLLGSLQGNGPALSEEDYKEEYDRVMGDDEDGPSLPPGMTAGGMIEGLHNALDAKDPRAAAQMLGILREYWGEGGKRPSPQDEMVLASAVMRWQDWRHGSNIGVA
jgi:hypothetical protein